MATWKKGQNIKLGKYFNSKEFENTTDTDYILEDKLIELLDKVREDFGKPIRVTSGYRSPEHNKKVGGHPNSTHTRGEAADISPLKFTKEDLDTLYAICEKHFLAVGDGRKRGFIHIDIRSDRPRRWLY